MMKYTQNINYDIIKKVFDNSQAESQKRKNGPRGDSILMSINRPYMGSGLYTEPRHYMRCGVGYPVCVPRSIGKLRGRSNRWVNDYWWYQWPCNTYIYKLPALCGVSDIDDNYVTDGDVPEDRFEISYASYNQRPLPLVVWRPDGSCVVSIRACGYGENGARSCIYAFTPVKYMWTRYGESQVTINDNYWIHKNGLYYRNAKQHYHVPRIRGEVDNPLHQFLLQLHLSVEPGNYATPSSNVNASGSVQNPGFIIPADKRKRMTSALPYIRHSYELGCDVAMTKLLSEQDVRRDRRHLRRRERAVRILTRHTLQQSPELLLMHPELRTYANEVISAQRINQGQAGRQETRITRTDNKRKQIDYSKTTGRAVHFTDA
ncbi:hypothetical protein [uncultured Mediterranean phage]|nr:hypothetical protein [uncultured Mediterranean phage]